MEARPRAKNRIDIVDRGITIHIDMSAPERNLKRAQTALLLQVTADMQPFVPFLQGHLRRSVRYPEGLTGTIIEYQGPYANYMYEGEVYGPNYPRRDKNGTIIGWYSPRGKGSKHPTGRALTYHTQGTGDHWFDRAAELHAKDWEALVARNLMR